MKFNVIVIDDCPLQLLAAEKLIRENKYLNLTGSYTDPYLGLQALNSSAVDLVILDIEMPLLDGLSLTKLLTRKESLKLVMNSSKIAFECSSYEHGAVDFIVKPLTRLRFDIAISKVLESHNTMADKKENVSTIAS